MKNRILIVDDDRELQENLMEILEDSGFEVALASNGEEALEKVKTTHFEVIFLDLMMPRMDGMEVLPFLKKENPNASVIMITAFATVSNAVEAMRHGADDYISKPFNADELLVTVKKNIEESRINFSQTLLDENGTFNSLANATRRKILFILCKEGSLKFMDIVRKLDIEDHTKVNFHLRVLKDNNLIEPDNHKYYRLTNEGMRVFDCLNNIVKI